MFRRTLTKMDGRMLELYSRRPIPDGSCAPSPEDSRTPPDPHLRWHPLRGEWVAYAGHRQNRTFLPPPQYNPLAPTTDPANPTELPTGDYDVAVFENLFPTLSSSAGDPPVLSVLTAPARGVCEVVVFTQDPSQSLGSLPLEHLELIVEVWSDRYVELGGMRDVMYVMPFENRGVEVGVTLHHPHGQIYAYPFVPPIPARELALQLEYHTLNGRGLFEDLIDREIADGRRMLYATGEAVAFVPVCARYSYEVWVAPKRAVPSLPELEPAERREFALRDEDGAAEVRPPVEPAVPVRHGAAPGADGWCSSSGSAPARGVLSGLSNARQAEVPRGQRAGCGRFHGRHLSGRQSGGASRDRGRPL